MKKPILLNYIGRSIAAATKLRNKGKFIKNGTKINKQYFKVKMNKIVR